MSEIKSDTTVHTFDPRDPRARDLELWGYLYRAARLWRSEAGTLYVDLVRIARRGGHDVRGTTWTSVGGSAARLGEAFVAYALELAEGFAVAQLQQGDQVQLRHRSGRVYSGVLVEAPGAGVIGSALVQTGSGDYVSPWFGAGSPWTIRPAATPVGRPMDEQTRAIIDQSCLVRR